MRSLFAYLRALTLPTSVFAAPEDWGAPELGERIDRAATELAVLLRAGSSSRSPTAPGRATSTSSPATPPAPSSTAADVDFDSPLMRLAAGGSAASDGRDAA